MKRDAWYVYFQTRSRHVYIMGTCIYIDMHNYLYVYI